jgi:CheY-like chemotaxis protein
LRVLCAEDEVIIGMAIQHVLEKAGHKVILAADGTQALAVMDQKGPFDLLVTDMKMPRMGGEELIRRVREKQPALPVIVVSAGIPRDVLHDLRDLGEGQVLLLEKPIVLGRLTDVVAQVPSPSRPRTSAQVKA